ncbi:FAD/NAD(P)-binding domain-containing protein [Cyathus striatus]|nr:FAD/NAD(P)-binding domain-containing protein [Cyathus striatus]
MVEKLNDGRKNVVILGGGSGAYAAHTLSKVLDASKYHLILIDARPHQIYYPATARLLVSDADNLEQKIFFPLDKVFFGNKGTFVQGKVTAIEKQARVRGGQVHLSNGEKIRFEILILAPGSKWGGPLGFPDEKEKLSAYIAENRAAFKEANDIVFVGGGAVSIEFAGEIKDIWPSKNITIVHGDRMLMNKAYPERFRKALEKAVRSRDIKLALNDYIDEFPQDGIKEVKTRGGNVIKADLVLSTRGTKPNTDLIVSSLGQDVVTANNLINVRPTMQLVGHEEIFAMGDAVDLPEQKQLVKAAAHAEVIIANVLLLLRGQAPTKVYKGSKELIVIPIGRDGGSGYLPFLWGIVIGNWFTRLVKSRGLFIDYSKKNLGLD